MKRISLLMVCLFVTNVYAETVSINVFANVDNNINTRIEQVNSVFNQSGIYQKYQIKPFINGHKIHLTMYLTDYDNSQLPLIESIVADIARSTKKVAFYDNGISLKKSNFLMLDVSNNIELQRLSDKITAELMNYRDKGSQIPVWAKSDPVKVGMFDHYGSPNVFDGFDPHFSIFAAQISSEDQVAFSNEINKQIKKNDFKVQSYQINSIGIGITDSNGQVIKLINTYDLQ